MSNDDDVQQRYRSCFGGPQCVCPAFTHLERGGTRRGLWACVVLVVGGPNARHLQLDLRSRLRRTVDRYLSCKVLCHTLIPQRRFVGLRRTIAGRSVAERRRDATKQHGRCRVMIPNVIVGHILRYHDFQGLIHRPTYYSQASICGDIIYFHVKVPAFRPTNTSLPQKACLRRSPIAIDACVERFFRYNIAFSSSYNGEIRAFYTV